MGVQRSLILIKKNILSLKIEVLGPLNSTYTFCIYVTRGFQFSQQLSYFCSSVSKLLLECPNGKYLILRKFDRSGIECPSSVGNRSFDPIEYRSDDGILLVDEINLLNFKQYNGIKQCFGRILDIVLSNDAAIARDCNLEALVHIRPKTQCIYKIDFTTTYMQLMH